MERPFRWLSFARYPLRSMRYIALNIIPIYMQILKKALTLQWSIVTVLFVLFDTSYLIVNQGIVRYLSVNRDNVSLALLP